ncbi:MAG: glutamine synthetase family protein [Pseudomonadota bacterium]
MGEHFCFVGNQELNGIVRGRSVPLARRDVALSSGLPWVPANITIGSLNTLPADNPFGPIGEIRLMPVKDTSITLKTDGLPDYEIALCEFTQHDGTQWSCCPRTALIQAVSDLQSATGLTLKVAFEHEFTVAGLNIPTHIGFSPSAGRAASHLAEKVLMTLDRAGFTLDQFVAEYGPGQYEIAGQPADPVTAADRTILTLEAIRHCARDLGLHASFLPKPALDAVGNGVHVHFSLWSDGENVTVKDEWVSNQAGSFLSGVFKAADALTLLSVTSPNSFARYKPQSWVGSFVCAGLRNREAMFRVVPRARDGVGAYPQASLEYRTSDATANVYLMLTGLIRAGLAGLNENLLSPKNVDQDPALLNERAREAMDLRHLPSSMDEVLADPIIEAVRGWIGPDLTTAYISCRRNDLQHAKNLLSDDYVKMLGDVY